MLRRRTAQGAAAAALLTGLLALSACTGPAPSTPTSAASRTTESPDHPPTPSPTPVDLLIRPDRPSAMDTPSAEGAAAAAAYFMSLYGYTWATGDTSLWDDLSAATCTFCSAVRDDVEAARAQGLHDSGSVIEVVESRGTEIDPEVWYSADLRVVQGPSTRRDSDGTLVSESDGGAFEMAVELSWADGWQVDAADVIESNSGGQ